MVNTNISHANDFRQISLCNVIYKIISDVVADKLEGVLKLDMAKAYDRME